MGVAEEGGGEGIASDPASDPVALSAIITFSACRIRHLYKVRLP